MSILTLSSIVSGIACCIFMYTDAKKRNMSSSWAIVGFLLGLIGLIIYFIVRKPLVKQPSNNGIQQIEQNYHISKQTELIPDTCPHCKNPNTKKIRLCEWCGSQIY